MTALTAAAAPIAVVLATAGAATLLLMQRQRDLNTESERAKRIEDEAIRRRERLADETRELAFATSLAARRAALLDADKGKAVLQKELSRQQRAARLSGSDLTELAEGERGLRRQLDLVRQLEAAIAKSKVAPDEKSDRIIQFGLRQEIKAAGGRIRSGVTAETNAQEARAFAETQLANNIKNQQAERKAQIEAVENLISLKEKIAEIDKNQADLRKQELADQQSLAEAARRKLQIRREDARRQNRFAQIRLDDLRVSNPSAFRKFQVLSAKKAAGEELTAKELRFAESIVGSNEALSSLRLKAASDKAELVSPFAAPAPSDEQFAGALKDERSANAQERREAARAAEGIEQDNEEILKLFDVLERISEQQKELRAKMAALEDNQ